MSLARTSPSPRKLHSDPHEDREYEELLNIGGNPDYTQHLQALSRTELSIPDIYAEASNVLSPPSPIDPHDLLKGDGRDTPNLTQDQEALLD